MQVAPSNVEGVVRGGRLGSLNDVDKGAAPVDLARQV